MNRKYPIGTFSYSEDFNSEDLDTWLNDIALLPERIREEIADCSDDILLTSYWEGGWNIRQIISHLLDSHMQAIFRLKKALSEDHPVIHTYDQDQWVEVEFQFEIPLELNLELLENIHEKLIRIFQSLEVEDWERTFEHPETGTFTLYKAAALYAWHSNHHLEHIRLLTREEEQ